MKGSILILGATSAIARAAAGGFAARGYSLFLAGRGSEELKYLSADLEVRYHAKVHYGAFQAEDYTNHLAFLDNVVKQMGGLSGVLLAFGYLGDQQTASKDFKHSELIISTNFTGAVSILTHCANFFEAQRSGFIIGISSVAGDRGRRSNYVYGAAKAGLSIFLQGLRSRLSPSGVRVITIKPGPVDTRMTFGTPNLLFVATPQYVGERIVRALESSKDIVYVPWFWRYIMWVVRWIPETVFKRLNF